MSIYEKRRLMEKETIKFPKLAEIVPIIMLFSFVLQIDLRKQPFRS